MLCEMCGADKNKLVLVDVDGALLKVCQNCAKFGHEKQEARSIASSTPAAGAPRGLAPKKAAYSVDVFNKMGDEEVVSDYPKRIREARLSLNLTPEELGKKINEKHSVIGKLESGTILPSDELVKKLEKVLNITLKEKYQPVSGLKSKQQPKTVTLGDLINTEDK
jgi:putative transcription factor